MSTSLPPTQITPDISAIDAARLVASGEVSSVELTTLFLDRIEAHRDLNAFIEVPRERALAEAAEADAKRKQGAIAPLLGVPIAVKDLILTQGVRTTAASKILSNFIPPYDATVVSRLRAAGAVVVGKTNLDEFAMGSSNETSFFGPVKNPWDTSRVPGGSSGGSAAAVAARLAPAALGTDTGGSIRQPAALCGIVGMKPTYGRVSRYGVVAYASSLDQVGPMTRTVADSALLCGVLSGEDKHDATSSNRAVPDLVAACQRPVKGLRVGIPREYFVSGLSPEVKESVLRVAATLEAQGMIPVDISLPHSEVGLAVYYVLAPAEASSNLARYDGIRYGHRSTDAKGLTEVYRKSRSEGFGREVKRRIVIGSFVLSSGYYDAYYIRAQKTRTLIAQDFSNAFRDKCDVILAPTSPTTAFKAGEKTADPLAMYLNDIFTIPVNLAGLPGMSVPCGFDGQGLPIGAQLIGRPFDEETLFSVAAAFERVDTSWQKIPNGFA
jgi:aspartyl-tRNA(Asn)/glutamyl-tRNA(Gln) amidotransferase subunit A